MTTTATLTQTARTHVAADRAAAATSRPAPVGIDPMLRWGNAFYLSLHGLVHGLAAAAALGHGSLFGPPTLNGTLPAALVATAWAIPGLLYLCGAALLVRGRGWRGPLVVATIASACATALVLPSGWFVLAVDAAVALGLFASRRSA